jgi:hypothetical protein
MRRILPTALLCLAAGPALAAEPPGAALFECTDWPALDVAAGALEARLLADPGLACRELRLRQGSAVECEAATARTIAGLPAREFGAASDVDGARRVRTVFRAAPARVREALSARQGLRFEAAGEDRWIARAADHPRRRLEVAAREDGSALLVCALDPPRDEAGEIALGIDHGRGAIAGRVSFPGGLRAAVRVCAVPREPTLRARCVVVPAGRDDYLLAGLAPGDYDVVSFALQDNPDRLVGTHATPLEDCAPHQPGCAGGLLVPVRVRAGAVETDIDPDRFVTDLPPRFDEVRAPER